MDDSKPVTNDESARDDSNYRPHSNGLTSTNWQEELDNQRGNGKDEKSAHTSPSKPYPGFSHTDTDFPPPSLNAIGFVDIDAPSLPPNPTSLLNAIGFVDMDATSSPTTHSHIPSLPHAAPYESDEPINNSGRSTPRTNRQSSGDASSTIIDMDEDNMLRRIETLSGERRWKLCFLF